MTRSEIHVVQGQIARFGLQICVGFPAAMFAAALILRKSFRFLANPVFSPEGIKVVGYVLIAVAVVDGLAAYLIKRRLINTRSLCARFSFHPNSFAKQLTAAYVPIFALCAMPAVYGLLFYFLGGDVDTYVLISVACPASFLLLKPREGEVERLASEIFKTSENHDIRL